MSVVERPSTMADGFAIITKQKIHEIRESLQIILSLKVDKPVERLIHTHVNRISNNLYS